MFGRQDAAPQTCRSPEATARILPVPCGLRQVTSPLCFLCSHKGAISELWEITCVAQGFGEDVIIFNEEGLLRLLPQSIDPDPKNNNTERVSKALAKYIIPCSPLSTVRNRNSYFIDEAT